MCSVCVQVCKLFRSGPPFFSFLAYVYANGAYLDPPESPVQVRPSCPKLDPLRSLGGPTVLRLRTRMQETLKMAANNVIVCILVRKRSTFSTGGRAGILENVLGLRTRMPSNENTISQKSQAVTKIGPVCVHVCKGSKTRLRQQPCGSPSGAHFRYT